MSAPVLNRDELLREDDYAAPHEVAGYRLHGGFDARGRYLSPRMAVRGPAVSAWQKALVERGFELLPADPSLLVAGAYPTYEQIRLMLGHGITQGLWNSLTITGVIEARGRYLADFTAPEFDRLVDEDLSHMAVGHMNKGLLEAHGLDEGGSRELGGHDAMWFAIRDLLLGKDAHPLPEVPQGIGRPEGGKRFAPDLPSGHEQLILFLMNVLMIEVRAETLFETTDRLVSDPELFVDRREAAELARLMVNRIRQDEQIHVEYLRTILSELRSLTFRRQEGGPLPGRKIIDPMWKTMVRWHAIENPRLAREQTRKQVRERILGHEDGEAILKEFEALDPGDPWADAA